MNRVPARSRRGLSCLALSFAAGCGDNFIVLMRGDAGAPGGADTRVEGVASGFGGESPDAAGGVTGTADAGETPGEAEDASTRCRVHSECLDNDSCNGIELCVDGACRPGTPLVCNDGNPCTVDACAPLTGACSFEPFADDLPCADTDLCDGEVCVAGQCTAGTPVICAVDQNPCTIDACDPATGNCVLEPVATGVQCSDGDVCNGLEVCAGGICLPGPALDCDDSNSCTLDSCDPVAGCVSTSAADGTTCLDNDLCNGTERCAAGVCQPGTASSCNDGNACTSDACNPLTGACSYRPLSNGVACPDGNVCDGQTCQNGSCTAGTPVVCAHDNDNNPCTANTCVPATGICVPGNVTDGTPCPDGDLCDGTETCWRGACSVSGAPLVCPDDGKFCTTDTCAPASGCLHLPVPDGMVCPDADLCDGTEVCASGSCVAGTPVRCVLPQACSALTGECQ